MSTATAEKPKTRKFRLLRGGHSASHWEKATKADAGNERLVEKTDPFTQEKSLHKLVTTRYEVGDTVEYDGDLVEKFGPNKFEEITNSNANVMNEKLLSRMTVAQLKEYAEAEEIDIEGISAKADLVSVIAQSS